MKFAKWGNSIAIRVPADVVAKLGISLDEEAQIKVTGEYSFEVTRDRRREQAIEKLRSSRFVLPDDYLFNREELHER
jgi:antitoxin MazE